jgi:hypothetical protein
VVSTTNFVNEIITWSGNIEDSSSYIGLVRQFVVDNGASFPIYP